MLQDLCDKNLITLCSAAFLAASSLFAQGGGHQIPLSSLTLNGSASYGENVIQLTDTTVQAGSAFIPTPYNLGTGDEFEVMFIYHAFDSNGNPPADGLAFVAQNAAGPNYLGENGSGLGFFTLTPTAAIGATFDYYPNAITGTRAGAASIAMPGGSLYRTVYPEPGVYGGAGSAGLRYVWVDYNNLTEVFAVYYSATPTKPETAILQIELPLDLSTQFFGQVYFGFTAGTGAYSSVQRIEYMAVDVIHNN